MGQSQFISSSGISRHTSVHSDDRGWTNRRNPHARSASRHHTAGSDNAGTSTTSNATGFRRCTNSPRTGRRRSLLSPRLLVARWRSPLLVRRRRTKNLRAGNSRPLPNRQPEPSAQRKVRAAIENNDSPNELVSGNQTKGYPILNRG